MDLLIEGVSEIIKNEAKEQKGKFLSIFLDTADASLLANIFVNKRVIWAGERTITAGEGSNSVSQNF